MSTPVIEFMTLRPVLTSQSMVPCAVRINAPAAVDRIPTHFVLVLDVSESMMDASKLENCKRCATLMLQVMTGEDRISLITFGEDARVHLKRVPADEAHKQVITSTIKSLHVDGCTNLSAGLGYVHEVCEGDTLKVGVLILTDGHANRGVSDPAGIRSIVSGLRATNDNLSVHCVAYGSDHNESLLRGIAEDCQTSYNVVNTIEDTAFAFGETLGGLMSCVYQNCAIKVPPGTKVHGPHKILDNSIRIGDVYAGTKPLVLIDIPSEAVNLVDGLEVVGMRLPDMSRWSVHPVQTLLAERDKDIELTGHRYTCASILRDIQNWRTLDTTARDAINSRITDFENAVREPFYDGHAVADLLRGEVAEMRRLLDSARGGYLSAAEYVTATQHLTSLGLARGFSTPMAPRGAPQAPLRRGPRVAFSGLGQAAAAPQDAEEENPQPPRPLPAVSSAFQNDTQTRIANMLRASSLQPEE